MPKFEASQEAPSVDLSTGGAEVDRDSVLDEIAEPVGLEPTVAAAFENVYSQNRSAAAENVSDALEQRVTFDTSPEKLQAIESALNQLGVEVNPAASPLDASRLKALSPSELVMLEAHDEPLIVLHSIANNDRLQAERDIRPQEVELLAALNHHHGTSYEALLGVIEAGGLMGHRQAVDAGHIDSRGGNTYSDDIGGGLDTYVFAHYGREAHPGQATRFEVTVELDSSTLSNSSGFATDYDYADYILTARQAEDRDAEQLRQYSADIAVGEHAHTRFAARLQEAGISAAEFASGLGDRAQDHIIMPDDVSRSILGFTPPELKLGGVELDQIRSITFRDAQQMQDFTERHPEFAERCKLETELDRQAMAASISKAASDPVRYARELFEETGLNAQELREWLPGGSKFSELIQTRYQDNAEAHALWNPGEGQIAAEAMIRWAQSLGMIEDGAITEKFKDTAANLAERAENARVEPAVAFAAYEVAMQLSYKDHERSTEQVIDETLERLLPS